MSKIILLSGFLGSGKTTLMQNMLNTLPDCKIGIIVNEIGKVSIDGISLANDNIEMKQLNNGSIFCACIKENFVHALQEFKKYPIDYLFIEASGISDPAGIHTMIDVINKDDHVYEYYGNICVLDGLYFEKLIKVYPVIEKQIKAADLILLNKTDLIQKEQVGKIKEMIYQYRPEVSIIKTSYCQVNISELIQNIKQSPEYEEITYNTPENKPTSFYGEYKDSISYSRFKGFLEDVQKDSIRIKGFVNLDHKNYSVNVVGETIEIAEINDTFDTSKLVFISYLGTRYFSKVTNIWKKHIGCPLTLN